MEKEKESLEKSEKANEKAGIEAVTADNEMSHCTVSVCVQIVNNKPLIRTIRM